MFQSKRKDQDHSNSPSSSPRGRRYVLKNLNVKHRREIKVEKERALRNKEYFDLRKAPASQSSINTSNSSSTKPKGTSNKVMPAQKNAAASPRKTPRDTKKQESPRKEVTANGKAKGSDKSKQKQTPRKGDDKKATLAVTPRKNEQGLTPRDEYMVTKLYDKEIIYLRPSEVRYTHDQITTHFTDGRSMLSTFKALLYGQIEIKLGGKDVPPVEVMQTDEMEGGMRDKIWYVVNGNRRLFVFRRLEKCGALTTMQVVARKYDALEMDKHFLTRNHGRTVSVSNDISLNQKFGKEVKNWKEWKVNQPKKKSGKGRGKGKAGGKSGGPDDQSSKCCVIS